MMETLIYNIAFLFFIILPWIIGMRECLWWLHDTIFNKEQKEIQTTNIQIKQMTLSETLDFLKSEYEKGKRRGEIT
jgi:hypothetical protein